jgi:hypothetical protein
MNIIYRKIGDKSHSKYIKFASAREISEETKIPYTTLLSWRESKNLPWLQIQNVVFLSLDALKKLEKK